MLREMERNGPIRNGTLVVLLAVASLVPATAQEAGDPEEGAWYARVRHLEGDLQVTNPREEETFTATLNTPLTNGDRLTTGPGGRTEIQLQGGSIVRVDESTRFDFQSLGSPDSIPAGVVVLRVWEGSLFIDYRQLTDPPVRFQIDTPSASVSLLSNGEFRIDVLGSGEVRVWSYGGEAEVVGDVRTVRIADGQRTVIPYLADPLPPETFNTARVDPFGAWVAERQEVYLAAVIPEEEPPLEELPPEMVPYVSELSFYGGWYEVPVYGWVWRPHHIPVSWRPYWQGYWRYVPAGWTWVSYEPWGWYPYHYGRWHWVVGVGWSWIPGRVFSGAWVSWAYSTSYVGWCPLNFYNQPGFIGLHLSTYDARGWSFVPYSRFYHRAVHRYVVEPGVVQSRERIHRAAGTPRFRPRDLGSAELGPRLTREARRENRSGPGSTPEARPRSFRATDPHERSYRSTDRGLPPIRPRISTPRGSGQSVGSLPDRSPDRTRPQTGVPRSPQQPQTTSPRVPQRQPSTSPRTPQQQGGQRSREEVDRGRSDRSETTPRAAPRSTRPERERMREILDRVRRSPGVNRSGSQTRRTPTSARPRAGSSKPGQSTTRSRSGSSRPGKSASPSRGTRTRPKSTAPRKGTPNRSGGKSNSNRSKGKSK